MLTKAKLRADRRDRGDTQTPSAGNVRAELVFVAKLNPEAVFVTHLNAIQMFTFIFEMCLEDELCRTNVKTKRHGAENTEAQN